MLFFIYRCLHKFIYVHLIVIMAIKIHGIHMLAYWIVTIETGCCQGSCYYGNRCHMVLLCHQRSSTSDIINTTGFFSLFFKKTRFQQSKNDVIDKNIQVFLSIFNGYQKTNHQTYQIFTWFLALKIQIITERSSYKI